MVSIFGFNMRVNAVSIYGVQKPDWTPGISGGIPYVTQVCSVKDFGAVGNGTTNDLTAFQNAINSVSGSGAVYVPAGTYLLKGTLNMKSGVVLRGAGANSTHLKFDSSAQMIRMTSSTSGSYVSLTGGYTKGSKSITVSNGSSFQVGNIIEIQQDNDTNAMYTRSDWNVSWAASAVGQITKVTAISGNTLTLEEPLRHAYKSTLNPRARTITPITNSGLEYMHIHRIDTSDTHGIDIGGAYKCWIRACEVNTVKKSAVLLSRSYRVEIRDSYFHDATQFDGGGHGYGIELTYRASSTLIENNIFKNFRHSYVIHLGATGNVFGYNYSREQTDNYPDVSFHGHWAYENLTEGNVVQRIGVGDWWGPNPYNTFLRNRVAVNVFVEDYSNYTYAIGNEIPNGGVYIDYQNVNSGGISRSTCIFHGNYESGTTKWESGISDHTIPSSYYLSSKPGFFGSKQWPVTGSDVMGQGTIPAQDRWNSGNPNVLPGSGTPTPTPTPTVTPTPTPASTNLALNKTVTYSSQQSGNEAYKAVDGDTTTRWSADTFPE